MVHEPGDTLNHWAVLRLFIILKYIDLYLKFSWEINAGEGVEKREPSYTVGGNAN